MKPAIVVAWLGLVACRASTPGPAGSLGETPSLPPPRPAATDAGPGAAPAVRDLACPAGTRVATGTWAYDEGKTTGPVAWCELPDHTRHGPWISRYADSKPAEQARYNHGVIDGEWRHFYPTGELAQEGIYAQGARQGTWRKFWGGGGALESEDVLDHDKLVSASSYFPNGKLEVKGGFADGAMDGEWSWFRDDGSPLKTIVYARGRGVTAWRYRNGHKESVPVDEVDLEQ
jgi:hypothetical protein